MSDDGRKPGPLALRLLGGAGGPYPEGLVVVQDDSYTDGEAPMAGRDRQDFKLVDLREVRRALGLRQARRRPRAAVFSFTGQR